MVRRNMNRRHMIDDHHDGTGWRATLLVRAMDEILGTHRPDEIDKRRTLLNID
jgi:hypothetical protein